MGNNSETEGVIWEELKARIIRVTTDSERSRLTGKEISGEIIA